MRPRRISLVLALAAAVPAVGLDCAAHHLDREHLPNFLRLAFAHARPAVDSSWLDYAAGIRSRRDGRCNYPVSPLHASRRAAALNRLAALGLATQPEFC